MWLYPQLQEEVQVELVSDKPASGYNRDKERLVLYLTEHVKVACLATKLRIEPRDSHVLLALWDAAHGCLPSTANV